MSSIGSSTQAQVRTVQYTHTCTCVHQVYAQVRTVQHTYIHISVVLVNYSCITKLQVYCNNYN